MEPVGTPMSRTWLSSFGVALDVTFLMSASLPYVAPTSSLSLANVTFPVSLSYTVVNCPSPCSSVLLKLSVFTT